MHAELTQLRLDGQGTLHVGRLVEEIAQAFRRSLGQTLHLAQIEPVGTDDAVERTEAAGQLFRAGGGDEGNVQLVDETGQRGTGGELRGDLALFLQLHAMFGIAQLGDHLAVVLVGEEVVDLVGHLGADVRQVGQHFRERLADPLERTQRTRQQLGGFLADVGNPQSEDEARQRRLAAIGDGRQQVVGGQARRTLPGSNTCS